MIEAKNLVAGYGKKEIIKNFSATFEKGRLVTLIGPNGAGKSTVIKALSGIIKPFSGEVFIDSTPISKISQNDRAKKISYLAQNKTISGVTAMELVIQGRFPHLNFPRIYSKEDYEIAFEAMKQMGIEDLANTPLSSLSGGTCQKVYIAMALAQNTEYILLDEPTTFLDVSHTLSLMKILKGLAQSGKGVICITHDLPLALTFSDDIALISSGELLALDSSDNIVSSEILQKTFCVSVKKTPDGYVYKL